MQTAEDAWFDSYDEDAAANDDGGAPAPRRSWKRVARWAGVVVAATLCLLWLV
jgi:hypothetical protein